MIRVSVEACLKSKTLRLYVLVQENSKDEIHEEILIKKCHENRVLAKLQD